MNMRENMRNMKKNTRDLEFPTAVTPLRRHSKAWRPLARWTSLATGCLALLLVCGSSTRLLAEPDMTPQAISDKVEDELAFDPGVMPTNIDVVTTDGIVTLSGHTTNLLTKERAARIAEIVKGVRAVVNRIEVRPSVTRTDAVIKSDVEMALLDDPATDSYELTTAVMHGEVTLAGSVDSYHEKELALTVAKGVRGVTAINDRIDVNFRSDRAASEIEHEVKQLLHWNALVDDYLINVSVNDGSVKLSGNVGSAAEKRLAIHDAWVAGVHSVNADDLIVSEWARDPKLRKGKYTSRSTDEIQQAINDAMLYDPRVMSFNVQVDVVGSTVSLRGTVDNLKAKRAAEQNARHTVGVSHVSNRLKVRSEDALSDSEIAERVRRSLVRDPFVERFEVTVSVIDGTAYLYGVVDSTFEKNQADEVASRVTGVSAVNNYLTVERDVAYLYDPYVDDTFVNQVDLSEFERPNPLLTDSEIKRSIDDELWWSPFVNANQVDVNVENGIATLTGTVNTFAERRYATENAYEGGATLVDNDLDVRYYAD